MECIVFFYLLLVGGAAAFGVYTQTTSLRIDEQGRLYNYNSKAKVLYHKKDKRIVITCDPQVIDGIIKKIQWGMQRFKDKTRIALNEILEEGSPFSSLVLLSNKEWDHLFPEYKRGDPKICIDYYRRDMQREIKIFIEINEANRLRRNLEKLKKGQKLRITPHQRDSDTNIKIFEIRTLSTSALKNEKEAVTEEFRPFNVISDAASSKLILEGNRIAMVRLGRLIQKKIEYFVEDHNAKITIKAPELFSGEILPPVIEILNNNRWEEEFPKVDGTYHKFFIKNYENTDENRLTIIFNIVSARYFMSSLLRAGVINKDIEMKGYPYYEEYEKARDTLIVRKIVDEETIDT